MVGTLKEIFLSVPAMECRSLSSVINSSCPVVLIPSAHIHYSMTFMRSMEWFGKHFHWRVGVRDKRWESNIWLSSDWQSHLVDFFDQLMTIIYLCIDMMVHTKTFKFRWRIYF